MVIFRLLAVFPHQETETLRHHCDQQCLVFWVLWVFICWESHYDVHCGRAWCRAAPVPSHAPPATITPLLSKWHNSQDVLPSLTGLSCSRVSTLHLPAWLTLQNISRLSIDLKAFQPSLLLNNKTFFHSWMAVFVGIDAFLVVWLALHGQGAEKEQLMVSRVSPHHYPIIVTKLPCKFP